MQRDMDLIRLLILKLEALPVRHMGVAMVDYNEFGFEDFTADQVAYHCGLIVEAGLVEQPGGSTLMGRFAFRRLSWDGHDFADSVRDEDVWQKTRQGALAVGGMTIDLVSDLAKGFIKKKIAGLTGVEL